MKKISILFIILIIALCGCGERQIGEQAAEKDYKFLSFSWGDSMEAVQQSEVLRGIETEITHDDFVMSDIMAKGVNFYGYTVDALLSFGHNSFADRGLSRVTVEYQEGDEGNLLAKMTEIYGEAQNCFYDENGIESPIKPFGWYTEEIIKNSLTAKAKEKYMSMAEDKELSVVDAALRLPLVIIRFDDEKNQIVFEGFGAAVVREFNSNVK